MLLCGRAGKFKRSVSILLHYFMGLDFNEVPLTVHIDE